MKKRLISALIMMIVLIPLVIVGGIPFDALICVLSILSLNELLKFDDDVNIIIRILSYLSLVLIIISERFNIELDKSIAISIILIYLPIIFSRKEEYNYKVASSIFSKVLLLGFSYSLIRNIRVDDIYLFLYLYIVAASTDIFAFLVGRYFGKRKLIPKVSPNKTIEGCLAGLISSIVIGLIFYIYFVDPAANALYIIIQTIILSLFDQLGDLFFSQIKRNNNIKDFSNIIPGHGGILDRFDSFIFVVITYTIITIF